MTALDWMIVIVLAFLALRGYRKGLVGQVFDLLGTVLAVAGAFYFFERVGAYLAPALHVSMNLANILGFILVAVVVSVAFGFAGRSWRRITKSTALSRIDGLAGAVFGVLKGLVVLIFLFLVMASVPWQAARKPVEGSFLAQDVLRLTPAFYYLQERSLPANVPRLMITPDGFKLRRFNYQKLDGATCVACGGKVRFDGLRTKGVVVYPHFTCTRCGLVSDGCLTFEGYHIFYDRCPWQARERINCKVWPNPVGAQPKGRCPVCGRKGYAAGASFRRLRKTEEDFLSCHEDNLFMLRPYLKRTEQSLAAH